MKNFLNIVNTISRITDESLRNVYQASDYRKVILPLTVIRRLDSALENTKEDVLKVYKKMGEPKVLNEQQERILLNISKQGFFNISQFSFSSLLHDHENLKDNFYDYLNGFSSNTRDIIDNFNFGVQIEKMDKEDILYTTLKRFAELELHLEKVTNMDMGYVFEELIRRFSENVEAGQHYTPREVISLMVELLFNGKEDVLKNPGVYKSLYDPTCGTGGMLSAGEEKVKEINPTAKLALFGQEINEETFAVCKSDMLLKGQEADNIKQGNTLTTDQLPNNQFDFIIANPPYGENWARFKKTVEEEHKLGENGRFAAGLPRTSDGSFLFLMHMVSKMKPVSETNPDGSRLAIVLSGSPLFTGSAGQGESEIRKWLLENDLVEAIIGLPNQLFYNTGINTYIWVLTNKKIEKRKGKVQLIDATNYYQKMKKSLGEKRNEISKEDVQAIKEVYTNFKETKESKIFNNDEFGYYRITVEQPLRLNYSFREERIEQFVNEMNLEKLKEKEKTELLTLLKEQTEEVIKDVKVFEKKLKEIVSQLSFNLNTNIKKSLINALSERDETAEVVMNAKKEKQPDSELRDYENVPKTEKIEEYFEREVFPHVPEAWIDKSKTKEGYEIPFTRHFYEYTPLKPSIELQKGIAKTEEELLGLMEGLFDEKI